MADANAQNYSNHAKFDPLFHFFLAPIGLINLMISIVSCIRNPTLDRGWIVVISLAGLLAIFKMRVYSLKVQDRVIRLEERLRLSRLINTSLSARIPDLTAGQLIALRFACDAEAPALAEKALACNMKPKEIKQAIVNWRPDDFRV
jgi:uncharacterized membrane protein YdbT with pleckstrin-like domain